MDKILLTGATGFIGSHVLEALAEAGLPVAVLVRPQADLTLVRTCRAEGRCGDLRDTKSVREAVTGCSQVIHTAGLVSDWGSPETFQRLNVVGTLNLLEACRTEGIAHVVITGSISSYGEENSSGPKNETCPYRSHYPYFLDGFFPCGLNWYRDSKAHATQAAIAFAQEHRLTRTVLEPVWVYGEREFGTGFYSYLKAVQDGQRFMPGSRRNRFHVVYAKDLAAAYLLACRKRFPGVERIIIGDSEAEPMHRIFGLFCREARLPQPRLLPKWLLYPAAFAMELISTLRHSPTPPVLTRGRLNTFYDSIQFSTEKARSLLGFSCQYSLEEGIRRTVTWYRNNQFLPC
jgi:nucleoside-diphosphate-sugar epimerase